jgi:magnesium and cobalt exporter, CNNM family
MTTSVYIILSGLLFLVGLRLSAFFSGNETGFYRLSFPRLTIEAQTGDNTAKQLIWFAQNPGFFVATTLVGNNIANYLTTFAISMGATSLFHSKSTLVELGCTWIFAPIIFIVGELLPKNLYFRAPMRLLRRDCGLFLFFFRLFLIASFPLILITRLIEKLRGEKRETLNLILGRHRLTQLINQGHREGIIIDVQRRLVDGLLDTAAQPLIDAITPVGRILGIEEGSSVEEMLSFSRKFGLSNIAIHKKGEPQNWFAYAKAFDCLLEQKKHRSVVNELPKLECSLSKLEALIKLKELEQSYALVMEDGTAIGLVSEQGLIKQLDRHQSIPVASQLSPDSM